MAETGFPIMMCRKMVPFIWHQVFSKKEYCRDIVEINQIYVNILIDFARNYNI